MILDKEDRRKTVEELEREIEELKVNRNRERENLKILKVEFGKVQ
jgi:hypothetical protein